MSRQGEWERERGTRLALFKDTKDQTDETKTALLILSFLP